MISETDNYANCYPMKTTKTSRFKINHRKSRSIVQQVHKSKYNLHKKHPSMQSNLLDNIKQYKKIGGQSSAYLMGSTRYTASKTSRRSHFQGSFGVKHPGKVKERSGFSLTTKRKFNIRKKPTH